MKKMTKAMLMTALICGTVYWGGTPVHASEVQEFALDEYVVTAARTETKLVDTPANISVVTADQIESRQYTNVAEVLKDVPGARVSDMGYGSSEKAIYLNGDERVLILVDGRRMNFDMGTGTGRSGYDMNQLPDIGLIERIEVLKGAGGALYGSEAVGGVVNIITKKGNRDFGKVSLGFGSNNTKDMSTLYSLKSGKTGVSVAASKYKQDYYKYRDVATDTTKRWPLASDYENEKVSLKIDQEIGDGSNITVGYDYSKFEGLSPYKISSKDPSSYTPNPASSPVDKKTQNIYAKYDWTLNKNDQGYIQYYHNELEYFNYGKLEENSDGIDIQQVFTCSETNKLVVGASWRDSEVENSGSGAYNESISNIAFFVNDSWEFLPSWTINAGIRYDDHSEAGDETTFSTGLNKKIDDNSHAYVNWGQVFRAPTTDDLYYTYMGNPNLKPETGDTWTVGYNTKLNEKTSVGLSYFESSLEDAIRYNPDNSYKCENIDEQDKKGLEFNIEHKLNECVDIEASYTYLKVENNKNGAGFYKDYNVLPNMYRLGVRYHDGKWNADTFLRAGSGASATKYVDSKYITLDMAITYKAASNLKIFAKGYNLFNEAYAEYGGLYTDPVTGLISYDSPAQSRRFLVGAEYSF